ncbi:MAG: uncharacterized protein QOD09_128 [Bradyrhizobium sp.]|jgi:antibiotic biosynthesis monooxygenase (ABM) superfamily enzyme|nr:uncharacterized protein [Bradyrhizobium sp.]MEA2992624.1 uncharacterized protein [Alphaproteobacteria bacterium]
MTDATGEGPPGESSEVTSIIQHTIKAGEQAAYEEWLREIVPVSTRAQGYRGINVIRPSAGSTEYTVVLHFDTIDNLRAWLDSEERRKLVDKVQPCLVGESRVEIKTGLEFWFAPPSPQRRARPFKQFLVTLSVIYPLTILIPFLLHPLFERIPLLQSLYIQQFLIAAAIVALIIYVIMPRYTPLIAKWLYR